MMTAMPAQQRGLSFGGFVLVAFLLVLVSITGFRLIPPYLEAAKIKNIFIAMVHDPDLQKASLHDVKISFDRRAVIDSVTAIKGDDIDISSENGRLVLSASYSTKVPLAGNISLYIEFNPSSEGK